MRRENFRDLKLRRQFQITQQFAPILQRGLQQRAAVEPEQIEGNERDRHIGGCSGEQISAVCFPSKTFLQIEEGQLASLSEGNNLAIEDKIDIERARLFG